MDGWIGDQRKGKVVTHEGWWVTSGIDNNVSQLAWQRNVRATLVFRYCYQFSDPLICHNRKITLRCCFNDFFSSKKLIGYKLWPLDDGVVVVTMISGSVENMSGFAENISKPKIFPPHSLFSCEIKTISGV